jgi:CDGSH-type Zn-finger protein/uncharacterized Fe-S cluster protein YjdI
MKGAVGDMSMEPSGRKLRIYTGELIEVSYDVQRCIHVAECLRGLPRVFDRARRPWILPSAASNDAIAEVVARCPSGALHFVRTDGGAAEKPAEEATIVPRPRGPLYVRGRVQLRSAAGSVTVEDTRLALCRCGKSRNKPFCDNSHRAAAFADPGMVTDGGELAKAGESLSITVSKNGPLLVQGPVTLRGADGRGLFHANEVELCRCGASGNKPFCDGSHQRIGFMSEDPAEEPSLGPSVAQAGVATSPTP